MARISDKELDEQISASAGMSTEQLFKWFSQKPSSEQLALLTRMESLLSNTSLNPALNTLANHAANTLNTLLTHSTKTEEQTFLKLEIPIQAKMIQAALNSYQRLTLETKLALTKIFDIVFPKLDETAKKKLANTTLLNPDFQELPTEIKSEFKKTLESEQKEREKAAQQLAETIAAVQQEALEAATRGADVVEKFSGKGLSTEQVTALANLAEADEKEASEITSTDIAHATGVATDASGEEEDDYADSFHALFGEDEKEKEKEREREREKEEKERKEEEEEEEENSPSPRPPGY